MTIRLKSLLRAGLDNWFDAIVMVVALIVAGQPQLLDSITNQFTTFGLTLANNVDESSSDWTITNYWKKYQDGFEFTAHSASLSNMCASHPNSALIFPLVIHGVHELKIDGKPFRKFGDKTFRVAAPFYSRPSVQCSEIRGHEITWSVYSYSQYFARLSSLPKVEEDAKIIQLFSHTLNLMSISALVVVGIFSLITFRSRISSKLILSIFGGSVGIASYTIFASNDAIGLTVSTLNAHRLADLGLWLGVGLLLYAMAEEKLINKRLYGASLWFIIFAVVVICNAGTGDTIQLGTSIPFPIILYTLSIGSISEILSILQKRNFVALLKIVALIFFIVTAFNDILITMGIKSGYMIFGIGSLGAYACMALIVNRYISDTYKERDHLLKNLSELVDARTKSLQTALIEKEKAQAELVHSAKLASLGTMSAGIAHEINNAINYINAVIPPLKSILEKGLMPEFKSKAEKIVSALQQGTSLTVEIVNSLRTFTGSASSPSKLTSIGEIVASVSSILRKKINDKNVSISVTGQAQEKWDLQVVSLNQIFMNLLSNAIDAVENHGKIEIHVETMLENLYVLFKDNGCGIAPEKLTRIFDPFFTTKDVGLGTGLGLYIVSQELKKMSGSIAVESTSNSGTVFKISIPILSSTKKEAAA